MCIRVARVVSLQRPIDNLPSLLLSTRKPKIPDIIIMSVQPITAHKHYTKSIGSQPSISFSKHFQTRIPNKTTPYSRLNETVLVSKSPPKPLSNFSNSNRRSNVEYKCPYYLPSARAIQSSSQEGSIQSGLRHSTQPQPIVVQPIPTKNYQQV